MAQTVGADIKAERGSMMNEQKTIISAFPGTGKSFLYNNIRNSARPVFDSDSSKFDKAQFPGNYITHINSLPENALIFCSTHDTVRKALADHDIPFILVYPEERLLEEYLERYRARGSSEDFIKLLTKWWYIWIADVRMQPCKFKIALGPGEYLTSVFSAFLW